MVHVINDEKSDLISMCSKLTHHKTNIKNATNSMIKIYSHER